VGRKRERTQDTEACDENQPIAGVTNNMVRRIAQHKRGEIEGFTKRHKVNRLVYFERYQYIGNAIRREKRDDLAAEWGKPIEPLTPVVNATKADPSLRS